MFVILIGGKKRILKDSHIFIDMLPKTFQQQNREKKKELTAKMQLYTIIYDYELTPYYGEYVKNSYDTWGNIVDCLGKMQITGYNEEEVIFNFHQLMGMSYLSPKKLISYEIMEILIN